MLSFFIFIFVSLTRIRPRSVLTSDISVMVDNVDSLFHILNVSILSWISICWSCGAGVGGWTYRQRSIGVGAVMMLSHKTVPVDICHRQVRQQRWSRTRSLTHWFTVDGFKQMNVSPLNWKRSMPNCWNCQQHVHLCQISKKRHGFQVESVSVHNTFQTKLMLRATMRHNNP